MSGVFIASLGHSGSTLLDLMLGSHPRLVSLGEIHATITRFAEPQNVCTCGAPATSCPIWGPIHASWQRAPQRPCAELRAELLERVRAVYGAEVAPVDSSKHLPALAALDAAQRQRLRVVFLVKDVRSFVASAVENGLPLHRRWRNWTPVAVARWYRANRRLERGLDAHGLARLDLGYEELCFQPAAIVQRLCAFLELPCDEATLAAMLAPSGERAHLLRGNHMRFDRTRRSTVSYDARWMQDARGAWAGLWMLPVMRWNRRHVWSNLPPRMESSPNSSPPSRKP